MNVAPVPLFFFPHAAAGSCLLAPPPNDSYMTTYYTPIVSDGRSLTIWFAVQATI